MDTLITLEFTLLNLVIGIAIALALLVGLMRWRTLVFRRRLREMELVLEAQNRDLAHKNIALNRSNSALRAKTQALESQKAAAELAASELQASINYAQRIQNKLMAQEDSWEQLGREHFILYRPMETLSGDFYWAYANRQIACWVVGDCTGHGVPGALMSMLGVSFLNELIAEGGETEPAYILELLRAKIIHTLNQSGGMDAENQDGMDVAICMLDKRTRLLTYAGANRPLYLVRELNREAPEGLTEATVAGEYSLYEAKGDRMSAGKHLRESEGFHTQSFPVWTGDTLYLLSDGITDQLGGPKGKKLMSRRLKDWLVQHQEQPLPDQGKALGTMLDDWMQGSPLGQIDDICVTGVRI